MSRGDLKMRWRVERSCTKATSRRNSLPAGQPDAKALCSRESMSRLKMNAIRGTPGLQLISEINVHEPDPQSVHLIRRK